MIIHGAYGRTNYAKALMYINRCIEYAKAGTTDSIKLALFYAHKGDDLWHYGEKGIKHKSEIINH